MNKSFTFFYCYNSLDEYMVDVSQNQKAKKQAINKDLKLAKLLCSAEIKAPKKVADKILKYAHTISK